MSRWVRAVLVPKERPTHYKVGGHKAMTDHCIHYTVEYTGKIFHFFLSNQIIKSEATMLL